MANKLFPSGMGNDEEVILWSEHACGQIRDRHLYSITDKRELGLLVNLYLFVKE